jgi:hypothetical protein
MSAGVTGTFETNNWMVSASGKIVTDKWRPFLKKATSIKLHRNVGSCNHAFTPYKLPQPFIRQSKLIAIMCSNRDLGMASDGDAWTSIAIEESHLLVREALRLGAARLFVFKRKC